MTRRYLTLCACIGSLVLLAAPAHATLQGFEGLPAGTVVAGEEPGGGTAPGTIFPGFTLAVTNATDGPHSLIIFDSASPTGGDFDLGSPNETCDPPGPGVGAGGEVGQPGENCVPQGNLLVIADNITDANTDDLVDDPNDDAGGGTVEFIFDGPVVVDHVTVLDIDGNESLTFEILEDGTLEGTLTASSFGDNSVEVIDLTGFGAVDTLRLIFSSSGSTSEIEWFLSSVPVQQKSWGQIKSAFGD